MLAKRWMAVYAGLVLASLQVGTEWTRTEAAASREVQAAADDGVPNDLQPLLQKPQSELRLVAHRYATDRATLNSNYDGGRSGGRGGSGRGTAAPPSGPAPVSLSTARIARLKRFDMSWATALDKLPVDRLTLEARPDVDNLKATIQSNLEQLEQDTVAVAELTTVVPFAPAIIQLNETRMRMQDVNSQQAAGALTAMTREIARVRGRLEAGLNGAAEGADPLRIGKDLATRGATAVDQLRNSLTSWFDFYNGYDPLFTWWMGVPFKHAHTALEDYAAFLREKVAAADASTAPAATHTLTIPPAPATPLPEVPDLLELIALPQDEMTEIVQRFINPTGEPPVGRGRRATNSPGAGRGRTYYTGWLEALKTLDFDRLSRNAQVDYLFIKNACERYLARLAAVPEANPPRKTDNSGISGAARGRAGLLRDLADEMIPYTPEQLIALATKELAWHEAEIKKASRQMGFGDDWKRAVEKVKTMHVAPGAQPAVVRDMLFEAIDYLRANDLITVPQIAAESLHMSMMTPEAQLSSPFFLGGSQIIVSYPTNTMEYEARLQSMRGNNIPFSHAVAHHEMIPGHNLVGFMSARYAGYRPRIGGNTPFFGEGWPLYWELILYDKGFHDTPEERVGALFWRMHRCARIIFSLMFHTGQWSPQESIDFLVDRVGHERDNATAEVRRSFQGGYGPLYQAAYLLGGLQLRGLRRELVDSGLMPERQFHDEILRQGSMPIALIRLALTKQKLTRDMSIEWKFYGELN